MKYYEMICGCEKIRLKKERNSASSTLGVLNKRKMIVYLIYVCMWLGYCTLFVHFVANDNNRVSDIIK